MNSGASSVIEVSCQVCGKRFGASPSAAGKRVVCPFCRGLNVVPGRRPPQDAAIGKGTVGPAPAGPKREAQPSPLGSPVASQSSEGAALTRVCSRCGKTVSLGPEYLGRPAKCTHCWATLPPDSREAVREVEYAERPRRLAKAASWLGSLVFHCVLFASLAGVTWLSGLGTGAGEGNVGIGQLGTQDEPAIDQSPAAPVQLDAASPVAAQSALKLSDAQANTETIQALESASGATGKTEVIGIPNAGGGAASGLTADVGSAIGGGAGGGSGSAASFFGVAARGGRFVYVVDVSGSMYDLDGGKLKAAKAELLRSISALTAAQKFCVVLYDHRCLPMPAATLVAATAENKRTFGEWIEQADGGGGTDPRAALEKALSLKPNGVWLMTDGIFEHATPEEILAAIRASNPGARIQINTIAFFDNEGEPILKRIARENRGKYRFVSPTALRSPGKGAPAGVP